jgi:hypothetical protein
MSTHECRQNCQCKKQVIPVIFVPDLMGTRLYNTQEGTVVWDPMAGMGSYHTPLGTAVADLRGVISQQTAAINDSVAVKRVIALQKTIKALQGTLTGLYKTSTRLLKILGQDDVAKRLDAAAEDANTDTHNAVAKVREELARVKKQIAELEAKIDGAFETMGKLEGVLQIGRNIWGMISVLEWMFRDATERRKLLVGKKTGRDDTLLTLPQDAETGSFDRSYFIGKTSVHPLQAEERFKRGWGEVCWEQYGEFLMNLQCQLDAHFNLRGTSQAGSTGKGAIPKPSLVTGKQLKALLAAIESLFDIRGGGEKKADGKMPEGKAAAAADAALAAAAPEAKKPEDKKPEAEKKAPPLPWGEAKNYALQMGGFAFPLHVVGYNWMQGCADGAQRLKRRIRQIAASYKPAGTEGVTQSWITREPVSQVIVITHGTGGLVMKALLAGVPPETDGKSAPAEGGEASKKAPPSAPSSDTFGQADSSLDADAATLDEASQAPQVVIKEELNPFTDGLELLKAIHIGLPENGTPETYAWFRAGMQTPVKADSKSDMAVAYVTNQVLGANAMEITAVLSYSQCALESLPNNAYPKNWLCWQPKPPEGSKLPEFRPISIDDDVYKFYTDDKTWHRLINKTAINEMDYISESFNCVTSLIDKSSSFMRVLSMASVCNKPDKFITGKKSKPSTRDKIVWQAQHYATPLLPVESWTLYGKNIPTDNPLVKGINSLFKTNLLSSLADSGEGTIYLTSPQMSADILPVEFVLQKGTGEGDGQVTPDAVKEAEVVACSEYHSDILQDEAIRRAVNTAIQQATWEYKAEQGK